MLCRFFGHEHIASIISLIGIVTGAGAISYAIVATAKSMIKKYGKKYAAAFFVQLKNEIAGYFNLTDMHTEAFQLPSI